LKGRLPENMQLGDCYNVVTLGYRRRLSPRGAWPSVVAPNRLRQQFNVDEPDRAWVTDITYIRTHDGWLYLAGAIDLFPRQVIGWSMRC